MAQQTEALMRGQEAHAQAELLRSSLDILRALEGQWRDKVSKSLTDPISRGLTAVLETPTEVLLEASTYRDSTAIAIKIKQGDLITSPKDSNGGSVAQIAAFLWQVYLLRSVYPPLALTMVLDEPFWAVSEEYRPAFGDLLRELANSGIQMLIALHEREMIDAADRAYVVQWEDTGATATLLKTANEDSVL